MEYFTGRTSLEILLKIQDDLQRRDIDLENFGDRTIFMSMSNDEYRQPERRGTRQNAIHVASFAKDVEPGGLSFVGLGDEERWYGSFDRQAVGEVELDSGDYDAIVREERASCVQVLISTLARRALK